MKLLTSAIYGDEFVTMWQRNDGLIQIEYRSYDELIRRVAVDTIQQAIAEFTAFKTIARKVYRQSLAS
jgi:hypothetical protein